MKQRFTFGFIALLFSVFSFAQTDEWQGFESDLEQENDSLVDDTIAVVGIHPWRDTDSTYVSDEIARWSLLLNAGFNVFDGDFVSEKKHGVYAPSVSLGAAYHFNSTWGLGVEYLFRQYQVTGDDSEPSTAPIMLKGMSHHGSAYLMFDIFNCWRPQNEHKLFALNILAGGGLSWKKNSLYFPNEYHKENDGVTITIPERWNFHTSEQTPMADSKYMFRPFFMGGVSCEFNVTRDLAVGLRCLYNYYTKDNIDGRERGNNNDGVLDVTASLRWKINGTKKSHEFNVVSEEQLERAIYASRGLVKDKGGYICADSLRPRTESKPQTINNVTTNNYYYNYYGSDGKESNNADATQQSSNQNVSRQATTSQQTATQRTSTSTNVSESRRDDTRAYMPARPYDHVRDTIVISRVDTIVIREIVETQGASVVTEKTIENNTVIVSDDNYYFIYFDTGKSRLKDAGLLTIQQIASRMKREPDMCAEIIGYCDNTGSNEINNVLGKARAKAVFDELIEEHAIDPSRMISLGRGKIVSRHSPASYSPNRRAEVRLVRSADFAKLREEYKDEANQFNSYEQQQQQIVREEKELPQGTLDKIELQLNTTLSKLARRYYRNTYCWVFIYEANKDVIANPNDIEVGTPLIIPELTDEQKQITKEQAIDLLNELQQ